VLGLTFFCERVVNVWSNLPSDIVDFSSLSSFKRRITFVDFREFQLVHTADIDKTRQFCLVRVGGVNRPLNVSSSSHLRCVMCMTAVSA